MVSRQQDTIPSVVRPQGVPRQDPVLQVSGLTTVFHTRTGIVRAVQDVSFTVDAGETLAIVGESGCGKTMTALSLMRLIPMPPGEIAAGTVRLAGTDLLALNEPDMRKMRGSEIAMIFQEPMTALNPLLTVGRQISEMILLHEDISRRAAHARAIEMLRQVRIPAPERRAREYPHQMSGGMRQRAMIAMALACKPKVLIADEPTTALDVTIQAQVLDLIDDLRKELGTAVVLITHDLGVVAEVAERMIVMYAGRKVEEGPTRKLFADPCHPYLQGLLASVPRLGGAGGGRLREIPGIVPPLSDLPNGCAFAPRCPSAIERCRNAIPPLEPKRPGHMAACWVT
jgi:peptide/nickel transport system ATP-binding protein